MPPRVYVETSVISYLAARPSRDLITAARQQVTHDWWRRRRPRFEVLVSQLVLDEARAGDPEAAARRADFLAGLPLLDVTSAAVGLARRLLEAVGLPPASSGRCSSHRHRCVPWNGVPVDLELGTHRECRISPASGTNVSRAWLRAAGALYAGRADGRGDDP